MSDRLWLLYARGMLEETRDARAFTSNTDHATFLADRKGQFAIVRALEIVGEAAKRVPASVRKRHSELSWRAMRDRLIHDYAGVRLDTVWETVHSGLPELELLLEALLGQYSNEEDRADTGG